MARRQALLMLSAFVLSACGSTVPQSSSPVTQYTDGLNGSSTNSGQVPASPLQGTDPGSQAAPVPSSATSSPGAVGGTDYSPSPASPSLTVEANHAPVSVGFVVADNSTDAAFKSLGLGAVQVGDQRAQVQAVVNDINSHGGLAGRKLNPVFHTPSTSASNTADQTEQASCDAFTVDAHVTFVVSVIVHQELFHTCLAKRGVPLIDDGLYFYDSSIVVPGKLFMPSGWLLDRLMRNEIDGLARMGFFKDPGKVGVLLYDIPSSRRVLKDVVLPRLAKYGKTKVDVATSPFTTAGATNQQGNVLKFQSDGVTRIFAIAFSPIGFMETAETQGYHPRYGLDSTVSPDTLRQTVPAAQLEGAVAVGWLPSYDVGSGAPVTASGKRCLALMKQAGQDTSNSTTAELMTQWCDSAWFIQAAVKAARDVSAKGLTEGAKLTKGYESATSFASDMTSGRPDGLSGYRDVVYAKSCSCFQYVGAVRPAV